jgi:beta-galactosidase
MDIGIAGSDFDNQEAHKTYAIGLPSPQEAALELYRFAYQRGYAAGFIHPEDDLSRLKLFYVPHWVMWKDEWTERLQAFAEKGGTVVIGARTGSRDINNHVIRDTLPGRSLADLTGITVEDFGRLAAPGAPGLFAAAHRPVGSGEAESARRRYHFTLGNRQFQAGHWYEHLAPREGTDVIGRWSDRFLEGQAVITRRPAGQGQVIYLGTYLTPDLTEALFADLLAGAGVIPLLPELPQGVEVTMREAADRQLLFIQNTTAEPRRISGVPRGRNLLEGGEAVQGSLELEAYGCAIIELAGS